MSKTEIGSITATGIPDSELERMGVEELRILVRTLGQERDVLGTAIAKAAMRVGIIEGDCRLRGSDLVEICRMLATNTEQLEEEIDTSPDELRAQRNELANAIRNAGIKAGVIHPDKELSGGAMIEVCDALANVALHVGKYQETHD